MRRGSDRGAATLLVLAMAGLLLSLGATLAVVAALVVAHRSAQSASDLASLAGAADLARGGDGCAEAGRVAAANRARLVRCAVSGPDIDVVVEVDGPGWSGRTARLEGAARAGPAP